MVMRVSCRLTVNLGLHIELALLLFIDNTPGLVNEIRAQHISAYSAKSVALKWLAKIRRAL